MNFAEQNPVTAISMCVTENCSLQCEYCFCGEKTTRDMSLQVAKDTIDWLVSKETSGEAKTLLIDLWGGEPLTRWSFDKEIINYGNAAAKAHGKRIRWNATTNGVHLNKEVCTDIKLADMSFMLSLDGDKETQDKYRPMKNGQSSYDTIVKNLPYMKEIYGHGNLRARATVRENNVENLYADLKHMHKDLGINQLAFSLAHESAWLPESLNEFDRQIEMITDWYIEEKKAGNELLWIKFIDDGISKVLYPRNMNYFCGAGRTYLGVGVDGVIYPCHRFDDFEDQRPWKEKPYVLGTIYDGLTNPEFRQIFLKSNNNRNPCKGCSLNKQKLCSGSCYAVNVLKSGGDISIPAHSGCMESEICLKHAVRAYDELIHLPAFRGNLGAMARESFYPSPCKELEFFRGAEVDKTDIENDINGKLGILNAANSALAEITDALKIVIQNEISEEQIKLALLSKEDALGSDKTNAKDS